MSNSPGLRFLRPYLCKDLSVSTNRAYLRIFSDARCHKRTYSSLHAHGHDVSEKKEVSLQRRTNDRITKLESADGLKWPRIGSNVVKPMTAKECCIKYAHLAPGARAKGDYVLVQGMWHTRRNLTIR